MEPYKRNFETRSGAVEDITNRLDQMNVDIDQDVSFSNLPLDDNSQLHQLASANHAMISNFGQSTNATSYQHQAPMVLDDTSRYPNPMISTQESQQENRTQLFRGQGNTNNGVGNSSILIVTNVDSSVFIDKQVKSNFEALFTVYDPNVTFRYLKSFRRVRLDFTSSHLAEMARLNLSQYRLGNTEFRCYSAQIIKANNNYNNSSNSIDGDDDAQNQMTDSTYLNIPKLTKQFLISPPASPPVGWEPVNESSPCIDVQLISAIANLVPGKVHEIHPGNESQPGIYVEVCEEPKFDGSRIQKSCSRIPKTPSPCQ